VLSPYALLVTFDWVRFILFAAAVSALSAREVHTSAVSSVVLERGETVEQHLSDGQSHTYKFPLEAGRYAKVAIEQRTIDVALACFGPDGKQLFIADEEKIGDTETAELISTVAGTYRIRVTASERHAPDGRYEITLGTVDLATERYRARVAAARAFEKGMSLFGGGERNAMFRAAGYFQDAIAHRRLSGEDIAVSEALVTLSRLYIELGERPKALEYATEALTAGQKSGDRKAIARARDSIGEVQNYFGRKKEAIAYYEQALPLMRDAGDSAGEGKTRSNLAVALSGTGERHEALTHFERALELFRELQDRRMLAEVSGNLAMTYDYLGEYQRALDIHQQALALYRDLGDRTSEAIALNNIGSAYSGLAETQKALDAYTAALDINRYLDNRRNRAINLNNIAWVYANLGERQRALSFYRDSLQLVRAIGDRRTAAITLNNIANVYADLGDYRKAIELQREALPLRRAVGDADGEANTLTNLGRAYMKLGDLRQAREDLEFALAILRKSENRYAMARTLRHLGDLDIESGDRRQGLAFLKESLDVSRAIQDRSGESAALASLARAERDGGNLLRARELADEALAALESIRLRVLSPALRATLFASTRELQDLNIEVLMRLHNERRNDGFDEAAVLASEKGRARSLLELLAESGAEIRRGIDPALLDRERDLELLIYGKAEQRMRLLGGERSKTEATAMGRELDRITVDLEQIQSKIREVSPQYAALTQPVPLNLREIQTQVLEPDTVLLEYSLGTSKSYLWAVTSSSINSFELASRAEIESAARRVYELATARNQKPAKETAMARADRVRQADRAYAAAAAKATSLLLDCVASEIVNKRLLIVGEGVLQYLPFAALPEPTVDVHARPVPLMVNHEIITAPSASVVALLRHTTAGRKPADKAVAVFADPVFSADDPRVVQAKGAALHDAADGSGAPDFARLRFSRNEAEEIAKLSPNGETLKALDFDASRQTALQSDLGQYRIVHFATHSVLDNEHPELSGIVLSLVDRGGHPQNGFLRLYDIYNLRLGSDLVVVSACQTALGEEIKGEGLIGLTRGFLYAGAPRIVASLWEVDDRTTAELMKRFYQHMFSGPERPAAALRAAAVALWKTYGWEAPYYWGAFTFQGEWR
jgi:CHAT domain-containing protein/Tfp pilus assembly protein PilF